MVEKAKRKNKRSRVESSSRRHSGRLRSGAFVLLAVVSGLMATQYTIAHIAADDIAVHLDSWNDQGYVDSGRGWRDTYAQAQSTNSARWRLASSQRQLGDLSTWFGHGARLSREDALQWTKTAHDHYGRALSRQPLSSRLWSDWARTGQGLISRNQRLRAIDRAILLGSQYDERQLAAIEALVADRGLDTERMAERVARIDDYYPADSGVTRLLSRAKPAWGNDPRLVEAINRLKHEPRSSSLAGGEG